MSYLRQGMLIGAIVGVAVVAISLGLAGVLVFIVGGLVAAVIGGAVGLVVGFLRLLISPLRGRG
ncbi:MAG: hypothetical protein V3S18_08480 [Dehalococcoidia bacterium]